MAALNRPNKLTIEATAAALGAGDAEAIEGSAYSCVVENVADRAVMGMVRLERVRYQLTGELTIWLGEDYWGHGFATEACQAMIDWAFDVLSLVSVEAGVVGVNARSVRLLAKLGFNRGQPGIQQTGIGPQTVTPFRLTRVLWSIRN